MLWKGQKKNLAVMRNKNFYLRRFKNMRNMNKKAFTLIELLIVIAIIGILFIVLVSKVDFATDKSKASGVQTDFRSFQVAFEQVAKENAGFTTFGWDCGDLNADGIRNSFDEGDLNQDGECTLLKEADDDVDYNNDGDKTDEIQEVFTGRKVYSEDWTGVWTLVKPGTTGSYDAKRIFALESAINKNLDPKLHITIATDGTITMANQARDPWKVEYVGVLMCNSEATGKDVANGDSAAAETVVTIADGKASIAENTRELDRGAIVIYSKGSNGKLGCKQKVQDGVVTVTVSTTHADTVDNNVAGKDDYSIATIYTFKNGYGEVISTTTGFSANQ
jgi:prepilin-type N-terminal cleavage/methylation domain-containing protein